MAKKKEPELTYMQMPLPSGQRSYRLVRADWKGLDKRYPYDNGYLADEMNISTDEYPVLVPSPQAVFYENTFPDCLAGRGGKPLSLCGFNDFLVYFAIHYIPNHTYCYELRMNYIDLSRGVEGAYCCYSILSSAKTVSELNDAERNVVQFNVFKNHEDVLSGKYDSKLLIFPDKVSVDFDIPSIADDGGVFSCNDMCVSGGIDPPDMDFVTVHLSRLFGVGDGKVYASGFNDYTNWELDKAVTEDMEDDGSVTFKDGYDENHAWVSAAQSNTKSSGGFTGITTFQNHVIAFKNDYMHEIYNTKNPFRIHDIYSEGCINNKSICDVGGMLMFVSEDGVKVYTGGQPKKVSDELCIKKFENAVCGSDGRNYYMYCIYDGGRDGLFVYDTKYGLWSQREITLPVIDFAYTKHGMFMLCTDGRIMRIDSGNYDYPWSFETDFCTLISSSTGTADIRHIRKIQLPTVIGGGARLKLYILYDNEKFNPETSHLVFDSGARYGNITIRVLTRQTACEKFRLHAEGFGYVKIFGLEWLVSNGGDLNVTQEH